jgi:hypothetical protein
MTKFEKPIKTDIIWNGIDSTCIFILGETDKAYRISISDRVRSGNSKVFKYISSERWLPKSIWNNEKHFTNHKYMGDGDEVVSFNPPYFLIKS